MQDVRNAITNLHETSSNELWGTARDVQLYLKIVAFDREKHSIVPIIAIKVSRCLEKMHEIMLQELGKHYFGVKLAFPPLSNGYFTLGKPHILQSTPVFREEEETTLKQFDRLRPRSLPMNLERFGILRVCCSVCGQDSLCTCRFKFGPGKGPKRTGPGGKEQNENIIYYSEEWFKGGQNTLLHSGPQGEGFKRWVVFDTMGK